jgi:hypothetical protein
MPIVGSDVVIRVAGVDITNHVVANTIAFESQIGAMPGSFSFTVEDREQTLTFTTGAEVTIDVDGIRFWGGYAMNVTRKFAVPAIDTSAPDAVQVRQWELSGVDYNILFDKRIIHNPANHLDGLPMFTLDKTMGWLLVHKLLPDYLDIGNDGLSYAMASSGGYIEDVCVPRFDADGNADPDGTKNGSWLQQGSTWRQQMDMFAQFGAVYYIDASKRVHFHEVETMVAGWGFSDNPNNLALPNSNARYGMREFDYVEDATGMINDAFVWGGSMWTDDPTKTKFKRKQNTTSITNYGRWQLAEVRFGDLKSQGEVTARANVIVDGNRTGASGGDTNRGLSVLQKQIRCKWYAHTVPSLSNVKQHLMPSMVVPFTMYVLGTPTADPLQVNLPLRSVRISCPSLDPQGDAYLMFEGFFAVQYSDPWWMWKFLRDIAPQNVPKPGALSASVGTSPVYGALYSNEPTPTPNGSVTTFSIPFAYIESTLEVYKNGLLVMPSQYTTSPDTGQFTFTSAPASNENLWVIVNIAGGI